jgi:aspartyl-tRNA(Asn)/glutamyl-tRNA(Gln) amidotransferase subunit A
MSYLDLSILELHEAILRGDVTPLELVKEALNRAKEDDNNAFEYICEKEALALVSKLDESKKDNLLWGIPFVAKDNFSTKDIPTTGSSDILKGYVPVFSAEVINKLEAAGAILIGKTTLDELAMGGSGTTGHLGKTYNPWDSTHTYQVGGSSCGSAAACANNIVPFALGSDTGDSVRKPASHAGLVGFKPTWGRISRFGLFPFAPSMDHVAYFTRTVKDSALLLDVLAGYDCKDATSSLKEKDQYLASINGDIKGKRIAVIEEILSTITDTDVLDAFNKSLKDLENKGAIINRVHMNNDICLAIYPTYIVISCAEATSNNANLDGIKFGNRVNGETFEDIMKNTRTNGFSELIKRRFIIGNYSLLKDNIEEVFIKAQKARRIIVDAVNKILEDNDCIYLPAAPSSAPKFEGESDKLSSQYLIADNYMAIGNFGGLPSLTLPIGFKEGMPFGANITCRKFEEVNLFNIAEAIETSTGLSNISSKRRAK